jgi:Na+-driven multidrug efflux pump
VCARAAQAFKSGDFANLRRGLLQDTLLLGAAMALFCATIMLVGKNILLLLYRGQEYAAHAHIVTVLALWQLAYAIGVPAHSGLLTIGRARVSFWIGFTEAVLTTLLVWSLVVEWGLAGAAYGLLIGTAVRATARWIVFLSSPERRLCSPGRPG